MLIHSSSIDFTRWFCHLIFRVEICNFHEQPKIEGSLIYDNVAIFLEIPIQKISTTIDCVEEQFSYQIDGFEAEIQ